MQIETKFLRLFNPVSLGDYVEGWRVCWLGGWDKSRVLFVVMVEKIKPDLDSAVAPIVPALANRDALPHNAQRGETTSLP